MYPGKSLKHSPISRGYLWVSYPQESLGNTINTVGTRTLGVHPLDGFTQHVRMTELCSNSKSTSVTFWNKKCPFVLFIKVSFDQWKQYVCEIPVYWLVNRDPYHDFLQSLYKLDSIIPYINYNTQGFGHCSTFIRS